MRWMLARIMALNLLSLYTLIFALFGKTDTMINQLAEMKKASAAGANYGLDLGTTVNETQDQNCFKIPISCEVLSRHVRMNLITSYLLRILMRFIFQNKFCVRPFAGAAWNVLQCRSKRRFYPKRAKSGRNFQFHGYDHSIRGDHCGQVELN